MPGLTDRVRRRQAPCADVALALPAYVAGETPLDDRLADHAAHCLRCQAEIVRYRRMLRTLHALRNDAPGPPSTVLADIIGTLRSDDTTSRKLLGVIVIVGVAAGAAGGAGIVVWANRRRGRASRGRASRGRGSRGRGSRGRGVRRSVPQEIDTRFSTRSATTKAITRR
jgi:hypothetical protein